MKKVIFMLLALTTISAQAAAVLTCTTPGDALSEVRLIENARGEGSLVISKMDQSEMKLKIEGSMSKIKSGSAGTFIAAKDLDASIGGEIQNAAMIQILPGQTTANLALNGSIYVLNCQR